MFPSSRPASARKHPQLCQLAGRFILTHREEDLNRRTGKCRMSAVPRLKTPPLYVWLSPLPGQSAGRTADSTKHGRLVCGATPRQRDGCECSPARCLFGAVVAQMTERLVREVTADTRAETCVWTSSCVLRDSRTDGRTCGG